MLFKREIKRNFKLFLIVSLICSALAAYVIAIAPSFGPDIQKLLDLKLPKQMQLAMGMNGLDYSSATGFYALVFSYIYLFFGIYLANIFAVIVSKEFSEKTAEYLFSLPAKRIHIILIKLSVAFIYAVSSVIFIFLASWLFLEIYASGQYDILPVFLMANAWLLGGLAFGAFGFMASSFFTRTRTASAIAAGMVLLMYMFQVVISLNDKLENLKYISPFDWFKGSEIVKSVSLSPTNCVIAVTFTAVCFLIGIRRFRKMDVLI
jgi:ABC-2 type transport system permease protein